MIKHLDLFSGIGGFALAAEWLWGKDIEHVFCDNEPFAQSVLKKHWPDSYIYGDIRSLTADAESKRRRGRMGLDKKQETKKSEIGDNHIDILTGGFPCQPFSQAGKRRGTKDDRYLWPEMLRVIREFHPRWVIAENVGGLVTWNKGMVFEQVCSDLENEGYEVQPFIIPACGVNAPHRRYRVWIVAHSIINGNENSRKRDSNKNKKQLNSSLESKWNHKQFRSFSSNSWNQKWIDVATRLCRVDDGLPARMDGSQLTKAKHREKRITSLGNAIVPQVAYQIMLAIKAND